MFSISAVDRAQLLAGALDEFAALLGGREVRFGGREDVVAAHQNHLAHHKGAHLARPAPLLLAVKTRHGARNFGFKRAPGGNHRSQLSAKPNAYARRSRPNATIGTKPPRRKSRVERRCVLVWWYSRTRSSRRMANPLQVPNRNLKVKPTGAAGIMMMYEFLKFD